MIKFGSPYVVSLAILMVNSPCYSQNFGEAVSLALANNSGIKAELSRLDAIGEGKVQAENLKRPIAQLEASAGLSHNGQYSQSIIQKGWKFQGYEPINAKLVLQQPLLLGGKYEIAQRDAQLRYAQGLAKVSALQISVIRQTLEAYSNVIADDALVEARLWGVANLEGQLEYVEAQKEAGFLSITDVSQVKSRLASAKSLAAASQAKLKSSWVTMTRLLGINEPKLTERSISLNLPPSLQNAIDIAKANNFDLKIEKFNEEILRSQAKLEKTDDNPKMNLGFSTGPTYDSEYNGSKIYDTSLNFKLVIPLWSGGQTNSRVRASLYEANASRLDQIELEQLLGEKISIAWQNLEAARENLVLAQKQLEFSSIAKEGTQLEHRLGTRSTFDVLTQEQEVLDANINLISAKRDVIVSGIALLTLMGIDPTGQFVDLTSPKDFNEFNKTKTEVFGIPSMWERPLVGMHDLLLDWDLSIRKQLEITKKHLAREK